MLLLLCPSLQPTLPPHLKGQRRRATLTHRPESSPTPLTDRERLDNERWQVQRASARCSLSLNPLPFTLRCIVLKPTRPASRPPSPAIKVSSTESPEHDGSPPPDEDDRAAKQARTAAGNKPTQLLKAPPGTHPSGHDKLSDSIMDPRELRNLPKKRTFQGDAMIVDTYGWPDPLSPPTHTEENPHSHCTRCGSSPKIPTTRVAFTDSSFDRVIIPMGRLLGNLHKEQADRISAQPEDYLAVLPHGAGTDFLAKREHYNRRFLLSLKHCASTPLLQPPHLSHAALWTKIFPLSQRLNQARLNSRRRMTRIPIRRK